MTVLGIHSNVVGTAEFTGGHAWITVTRLGATEYYGLWPDEHPMTPDNGSGSDIRIGMEAGSAPAASRYYQLTARQEAKLNKLLAENIAWGYTHNCSSWAHDIITDVVGVDVDADDLFGFETPRELGRNILILESKSPTSQYSPRPPTNNGSSSFR